MRKNLNKQSRIYSHEASMWRPFSIYPKKWCHRKISWLMINGDLTSLWVTLMMVGVTWGNYSNWKNKLKRRTRRQAAGNQLSITESMLSLRYLKTRISWDLASISPIFQRLLSIKKKISPFSYLIRCTIFHKSATRLENIKIEKKDFN